ncbi:MAG: hypothetical protein R3C19_12080 [Planctomycetaceae bacterium]
MELNVVRQLLVVCAAVVITVYGTHSNADDEHPPALTGSVSSNTAPGNSPQDSEREPAEEEHVPPQVELIDGGTSPANALKLYAQAAAAGDHEAALLMFDPGVRSLFRTEMIVERTLFESTISEYATFGEPDFELGGTLQLYAQRDLVRPRSAKILETRRIDDDRTVMTVLTTEKSYNDDEDMRVIRQYVAVRMNDRWYLFRPLGSLIQLMRAFEPDTSILRILSYADEPLRESADFEERYEVPIETIHEEVVKLAKDEQVAAMEAKAITARRRFDSAITRLIRGDITSRGDFKKSVDSETLGLDSVVEQQLNLLKALVTNLQNLLPPQQTPGPQ